MIDVSISFEDENMSEDEAAKLEDIICLVVEEYVSATNRFGKFASAHEGIAIVQEEFEELKNAVFWPHKSDSDAHEEATQLTAMGLRFLVDIIYG